MARKINPLLDLAWATKSEEAIIGQITSEIINKGWSWDRWSGNMGDIRKKVKSTRPHHGVGKKRLAAVIAAIDTQEAIRRKRGNNRPINWSDYRPQSEGLRRNKILYLLTGLSETCPQLTRINGELIFVASVYSYYKIIIVRDTEMLIFDAKNNCGSKITTLAQGWHPTTVRLALQSGGSVSIDFKSHETIVKTVKNGETRTRRLPWPEPQRWVKTDSGKWSVT